MQFYTLIKIPTNLSDGLVLFLLIIIIIIIPAYYSVHFKQKYLATLCIYMIANANLAVASG